NISPPNTRRLQIGFVDTGVIPRRRSMVDAGIPAQIAVQTYSWRQAGTPRNPVTTLWNSEPGPRRCRSGGDAASSAQEDSMQASPVPVSFRRGALAFALALVAASAGAAVQPTPTEPGKLHVPSPDWRDQVIYFVMIDRFADADPGNNDQGVDEYDPADPSHYSGGDIEGITRRLDYINGLGATALWITPPVANQWWNPAGSYSGYHGYWASDFGA